MINFLKKLFSKSGNEHKMGLIGPDKVDERDHIKIPVGSTGYSPINLSELYKIDVRNQRQTNSCSGFAGAVGLEILAAKLAEKTKTAHWNIKLSAFEIYYHARWDKKVDNGAFMRDLMKAMHKHGSVDRRYWTDIDSAMHRPDNLDFASKFKIRGCYERIPITNDFKAVEDCIKVLSAEKLPIWIGMPMYDIQTRRAGMGEVYDIPSDREKNTGGHAMTIVGWEYHQGKRVFIVHNSWGDRWGRNGFFRLSEDVIAGGWQYVFDLWTVGKEYY